MPGDPSIIVPAMAVAAVVAAVVVLATGWGRGGNATRAALGWVVGVGAAFYLGAWRMDLIPEWGLAEFRHRLLFLVLPAAIVIELIAAFPQVPRWAAWLLRVVVAAGTGVVLLRGSVYLQEWTPQEMAIWLGGPAAALLAVWTLLGLLLYVAPARATPLALAGVSAAAALTIMLSSSATDGQPGLPLAAALGGAALASFFLPAVSRGAAPVGVGLVALYALLVGGRFFADVTTTHAAVLLASPLLCWLPQLPYLRKLNVWLRDGLCLLLVMIPTAVVVFQAHQEFTIKSQAPGESDDYEELYRGLN